MTSHINKCKRMYNSGNLRIWGFITGEMLHFCPYVGFTSFLVSVCVFLSVCRQVHYNSVNSQHINALSSIIAYSEILADGFCIYSVDFVYTGSILHKITKNNLSNFHKTWLRHSERVAIHAYC